MKTKMLTTGLGATLLGAALCGCLTAPASASEWCGENGLIRLAFDAEGVERVARMEAADDGTTTVELFAVLTDVARVQREGEAFLALGGIELLLSIEGADGRILEEGFPVKVLNVGKKKGHCVVGYDPGLRLERDGATQLARWKILFVGAVEDVTFRLDPAGLVSCETVAGCEESGSPALYIGSYGAGQLIDVFGAGYAPAALNPTVEPQLEPVHGQSTWAKVGRFAKRE